MILVLKIFVLLSFVVLYLYKHMKLWWRIFWSKIPRVENCYPIVGHALSVIGLNEEERYVQMLKLANKHDRMAIFWLGPLPIVGVIHPDLIQKVYQNENYMEKPAFFYNIFGVDNALISTTSHDWKSVRKIMNYSFSPTMLQSFIPSFANCADKLNDSLSQHLDGSPFDLLMQVSKYTLDMLLQSNYGLDEDEETKYKDYEKIIKSIDNIHTGVSARFNNPLIRPTFIYKLTKLYKMEMFNRHQVFSYQDALYNRRKEIVLKQQQHTDNDTDKMRKPKKISDTLIFNENNFSEDTIRDNDHSILFAGFETSANQACHTILMLAMFQDIQEKAYREVKEVFHSDAVEFNLDTLNELKYLDQVIRETMRLFTVVPFICKTNTIDLELDGHMIPKGATIFMLLPVIHRCKDIWGPNADNFDPENFSPENSAKRHPYALMTFSMGKRNCLGYKYAMLSIKTILAKLLLKYKLSTDLKFDELKFCSKISLKLCTSYGIKLAARN